MSRERATQLIDAGIWLKLSGDVDGARRLFERALKLDPENPKAKELLATPTASAQPASPQAIVGADNPFERVAAAPLGANDADWGAATGFELPPAPVPTQPFAPPVREPLPPPVADLPTDLPADWGSATGSAPSPVPAVPQGRTAMMFSAADLPPATMQFASTDSQARTTSVQFASTDSQPRTTSVQFASTDSQPRTTSVQFASTDSQPRTTSVQFGPMTDAPPARQTTVQFAGAPTAPKDSTPSRQTMVFAGTPPSSPGFSLSPLPFSPPAAPVAPPPIELQSPTGTGTMMFASPATPMPAPAESGFSSPSGARSTLAFSGAPSGPLAPSTVPEVKAVVIRLEQSDEAESGAEEDPVVEMLRRQVDAAKSAPAQANKPWQPSAPKKALQVPPPSAPDPLRPATVVLVDRTPEPSPPRATPPMFTEDPPPLDALHGGPSPSPIPRAPAPAPEGNAWNWSSSPPPASRPSDAEEPPAPRPSPALVPQASSAWDQRSNPGIKMDDIVAPDRTMEFVSSSSKITRSPEAQREEIAALLRGARDLIDLDDHTGAMELIGKAQALAPDDPDVQQLREKSERTLLAMFESKLGHLEKVPRVMLKDDEIIWLNLDHRAGFVLAQIDGTMTFEDLFAVSGMSRIDTARILAQLVDEGVISRA
jgi:hypothetical protein